MSPLALWLVTGSLLSGGLVGILFPIIPGIVLVFAGILFYALATQFASISPLTVAIFGVFALLLWALQYAGAVAAARVGGGSIWTIGGIILGSLAGLFAGGPAGLLLGSFCGALCGALYEGHSSDRAVRIATASVIGILGATAAQFVLAVSMVIAFFVVIAT